MAEKWFVYNNNTGGVNLRSNEANINTTEQRTEMNYVENMSIYQEGGIASQAGNAQLNTGVTDTSAILGIGEYKTALATYAVYLKASGKAYSMLSTGGAETLLKSGLSASAIPQFVPFNSKVVIFNGVDQPWSWDTVTAADLTGTPAAWVTTKPTTAAVFGGRRIFAAAGSTIYYCALGNENDWTTGSDAGSLTGLFNDNTNITGVVEYGTSLAVHSESPGITLIGGTQPSDYAARRIASNRSMVGKLAFATINDNQFFFSGDGVLPIITTDLGVIRLGKESEISYKVKPFLKNSDMAPEMPLLPVDEANKPFTILLPNYSQNELVGYFKTSGNTYYDTAAVFNFDLGSWVFRKASLVSAAGLVDGNILTGTSDGRILQENVGRTLYSGDFNKRCLTGFYNFGAPHLKKALKRLVINFKSTTDINVTIYFKINYNSEIVYTRSIDIAGISSSASYGVGAYGVDTYSSAAVVEFDDAPSLGEFKSIQLDINSSDPSVDFRIIQYGFEIEFNDPY